MKSVGWINIIIYHYIMCYVLVIPSLKVLVTNGLCMYVYRPIGN